jgi:hypothetical protein
VEEVQIAAGTALLPLLNDLLGEVTPLVRQFGEWTSANPELVATIAQVAGGLLALKVGGLIVGGAVSTVTGTFLGLHRGIAGAVTAIGWIRTGLAVVIPFLSTLAGGIASAVAAFGGWGAVFAAIGTVITGPVGIAIAVVTALAGAAWLVIRNWDALKAWFAGIDWRGMIPQINWRELLPDVDWRGLIARIDWRWFIPIVGWALLLGQLNWRDIIPVINWRAWIPASWAGLVPRWNWSAIIPRINIGQFISGIGGGGAPAGAASGGPGTAPALQRRASGGAFGPTRTHGPLLVGELGPELYYPDAHGFIAHHRQLAMLADLSSQISLRPPGVALRATGLSALRAGAQSREQTGRRVGPAPVTLAGDLVINAAPGQDPRAIADAVMQMLDARANQARRTALHDLDTGEDDG